jgi:C-terminal processing protease CtpA/Prc
MRLEQSQAGADGKFRQNCGLPRPWLGMYVAESDGRVVVQGLAADGPSDKAGVHLGDAVTEVAGAPVGDLAQFFRAVWRQGPAGTMIPLTIRRGEAARPLRIRSADRSDFLKKPSLQ